MFKKKLGKISQKPQQNLMRISPSAHKKTPNNLTKKLTKVSLSHKNLTKNKKNSPKSRCLIKTSQEKLRKNSNTPRKKNSLKVSLSHKNLTKN